MRHKYFIFLSLLSAYLLMFAHSFIPHHHHEAKQEADNHHKHEQSAHHHQEPSEGHGHTPHFVHSPDFGNYVVAPSLKLIDLSQFHLDLLFFAPTAFNFHVQHFVTEVDWLPDLPPPYKKYTPLPNGLRGSPTFIS
jgi:hypothetical protein